MRIGTLTLVITALLPLSSVAADWSFDPTVAVSYEYNDNNRLSNVTSDEIEVSGAKVEAELAMSATTPRSQFELAPRLRSTFFPGDESEEADDQFVRLSAHHSTERTTSSINAYYSLMETLGDYFPNATVSEDDKLGEPDRGVGVEPTAQRNREDRLVVQPGFSFQLDPKKTLQIRLGYLDVSYDTQVEGDRENYEDLYASLGLEMALTRTSSITFRGGWSTYDPADGDSTDAQQLDAEWRNRISDTGEVYVRAGVSRVESISEDGGSSWDTGFTGGGGVRWAFEITDVWFDASTYLDPNPVGDMVNRNEIRFQLTRRLSPLTSLRVGARVIDDSGAGNAEDTFLDRTYATANLGFDWRIARAWTVFAVYNYNWSEYSNTPSDADSNSVSLGIAWRPNYR